MNLDHHNKFGTLLKVSHVCNLQYLVDWKFKPVGETKQLLKHQEAIVRRQKTLAELLDASWPQPNH